MITREEREVCSQIVKIINDCQIEILKKAKAKRGSATQSVGSWVSFLNPSFSSNTSLTESPLLQPVDIDSLIEEIKKIEWNNVSENIDIKGEICSSIKIDKYNILNVFDKFVSSGSIKLLSNMKIYFIHHSEEFLPETISSIIKIYKSQLEDFLKNLILR